MWFLPLVLTPVFLIELLVVFTFCGTRNKLRFLGLITTSVALMFVLSHGAQPNKAVWTTATGFVLHNSLRPRPVLPLTMVVNVKATALNPVDYKLLNMLPNVPFVRWVMHQAPALDVSGVVADAGWCGDRFKAGDEVFGAALGGTQEFAVVLCPYAGKLPASSKDVSFVQGAATLAVMTTAQSAFRYLPPIAAAAEDQTVVIVGASGGCGLAAALLAKHRGVANVVCVSSSKNHALVLQHGCTEVYDYTKGDAFFQDILGKWAGKADMVYDTVSALGFNPYFPRLVNLLKPEPATYVGADNLFDQLLVGGPLYARFAKVYDTPTVEDFAEMERSPQLFKIKIANDSPVLPDALNVTNVAEAYKQLKSKHTAGKLVLTVGSDQTRGRQS